MISWDEAKRQLVLQKRGVDFADLERLLHNAYIEDQKSDDPEQYRIVGRVEGRFLTFVVEYLEDELGELTWVVTGWDSTPQEREAYEQEIGTGI